jgi:hypothetical protein
MESVKTTPMSQKLCQPCAGCRAPTGPHTGFLCDHVPCWQTICQECHPSGSGSTWWCSVHRPQDRIPILGWKIRPHFLHPGREPLPTEWEVAAQFDDIPTSPAAVAAKSITEDHRRRTLAEVKHFSDWLVSHKSPRLLRKLPPETLIVNYIHQKLCRLAKHPVLRLRVKAPSVPTTWARRLVPAFDQTSNLLRAAQLGLLLRGYQALAPSLRPVERDVEARWESMRRWCKAQAPRQTTLPQRRLYAALWLGVELQVRGFRPKAAMRGPLPQGERLKQPSHPLGPSWRVSVLLDKDNAVGVVPALRRRLIPSDRETDRLMSLLPYPNDRTALTTLTNLRSRVRLQFGIRDLRSSRRDALKAAEAKNLDPGQVGNHRPGSMATPRYTGTMTPSSLQMALR